MKRNLKFYNLKISTRLIIGYVLLFTFFIIIGLVVINAIKQNDRRAILQSELNGAVSEIMDIARAHEVFSIRGEERQRTKINGLFSKVEKVVRNKTKATHFEYPELNEAVYCIDTIKNVKDVYFKSRMEYDSLLSLCITKIDTIIKFIELPIARLPKVHSVSYNKQALEMSRIIHKYKLDLLQFKAAPAKLSFEKRHNGKSLHRLKGLARQMDTSFFMKTRVQKQAFIALVEDLLVSNSDFMMVSKSYLKESYNFSSRIQPIIKRLRNTVTQIKKESADDLAAVISLIYYLIGGVLLLSCALSFIITRSVTDGITEISRVALSVAKGKLGVKIQSSFLTRKDEIGDLSRSFGEMTTGLKETIDKVKSGVEYLKSASTQLNSSSEQLSTGASQQASSVEEISSTVEEMVANIEQNASHASKTQQIADITISEVKEVTVSTNAAVKKSEEISKKVIAITDIARQTNILALNASVEAARAGTAGRGFSVVAQAVKELAEKSNEASSFIGKLSMQGYQISQSSGDSLNQVLPELEKTGTLITEISVASQEQKTGANQINSALNSLNGLTQVNATQSEEIAASAHELKNQAQELFDAIATFNTEDEEFVKDKSRGVMHLVRNIFRRSA
ncbi:methyl-accepting chemotaxis protein [Saccharicrinis aurantiacus]|uniref:methyl-accepting chemotaxis protein n=1 Tax=Saccharicrinis aurantiacus TaxID=1849719 RepID=UPI00249103EE|nr:HAMP domain-containing methyl-accepting chemotaxis protein [Saccharicrinis aurantiacus]